MSDLEKNNLSAPVEAMVATYLHGKAGKLGVPISANFELTSRCNFNCRMCYIHNADNAASKKELSTEEWLEIGKQAAECGIVFLLLTGGEPLVRKDFPEIYSGLKKLGFIISINTNGSLIRGELLELLKKEPPFRLNISLYGTSDSTYENLCQNRSFSVVKQNIEALIEAGIQVKLNYSITPYNCNDMDEVFAFARQMNIPVQPAAYMYPPLRSGEAQIGDNVGRFTPEEAAFYRVKSERLSLGEERFLQKAKQLREFPEMPSVELNGEECKSQCRAGRTNCWIDWRGNMSMCGMIPAGDNNVLKKGFSECWEEVKKGTAAIRLPKKCTDCRYKSVCGVCASVCMCETGKFDEAPEYMCRLSETTFEKILNSIPDKNEEEI